MKRLKLWVLRKFLTLPYVERLKPLAELEMDILLYPDKTVCPTCLSNCGQCGGDGHHVKLKDLKNHHDYHSGWTRVIGGMINR